MLCTKCGKWERERCAMMKKVFATLTKVFVCERCVEPMKGIVKLDQKLCNGQMEFVESFCYLKDKLYSCTERKQW